MEIVTLNDKVFDERIAQLVDVLQAKGIQSDPAIIIADEARLFLKQAIKLSPPRNKEQGENAIKRDAGKVFTPMNEDFLITMSDGYKQSVDRWFTAKSGADIHAQFDHVDLSGERMNKYYQARRSRATGRPIPVNNTRSGGRISFSKEWFVDYAVGYPAFAAFVKKQAAKVGMRKSGWAAAYISAGGNLPSWITRQLKFNVGKVENQLARRGHPSIVMASRAPGVQSDERVLRAALKARSSAIAKRIKLILSGYAADVKAGIKIRNHAVKTSD